MFDNFDTNVSAEEFYRGLYNSWEVDNYEHRKEENKPIFKDVSRRADPMVAF